MADPNAPLVISAPHPRTIDLIFTPEQKKVLNDKYRLVEIEPDELDDLPKDALANARYILGQPPVSPATLSKMKALRCVLNVESNLFDNMPYQTLFERGIHVVTTGAVFAMPVAELGIGLAISLARGLINADNAFRDGSEKWGGDGNAHARLLTGSDIGIIGFGDLGRALTRVLSGFRANIKVFDPWLPPSVLTDHQVIPASLDEVLNSSDTVFVVASVTSENEGFLGATQFSSMRPGASFILLSRAAVVDFPALVDAVKSGHITAASDVFPEEPVALDDPIRTLPGFIRSAHRAGALDSAFTAMGDMVLEDMDLMDRGLPPMRCKRAERETVSAMRSKPVTAN